MVDVKAIRDSFGWSQQELADRIGIDRSTASRWEKAPPSKGPALKLLKQLEFAARDGAAPPAGVDRPSRVPGACGTDPASSPIDRATGTNDAGAAGSEPQDADRVSTAGAPGDLPGAPALSIAEAAE